MPTLVRLVRIVKSIGFAGFALPATLLFAQAAKQNPLATQQNPRAWMHEVRIGAYGLKPDNAAKIVRDADGSGVYGIEVDNDIPGRYESFVDPTVKLNAIRQLAKLAHQHGNHAFVYIAGLECITANAASTPHTMAKDHPDWLQRDISGKPAIFNAGTAFWIRKGDEDVWVTPYATGWRKIYMERVRQIASTGIDGIYVDIPYWMTHFTGWENSWASFDDYTVAAFRKQTGLNARKDIKLGDFSDPGFRKWVNFRIRSITDFLAEIRKNATSVNPNIAVIPEIYPGIEESAVRVGADVYQIYPVVDAVAHEYEFGNSDDHTAASRGEFDWFMYQIGMQSFRAFAQGKPTWMLNYSWDGNPRVTPSDAMKNLAMSELMAGANFWDAPGHSMAGSNDMATRKEIFAWIAKNEDVFNSLREPLGAVGVYFSDATRNYFPKEFVKAYRGVLLLLLRNHIQFQIVTPRTLGTFSGSTLVLPDVCVLSGEEIAQLRSFASKGGRLILTGNSDSRVAALPKVLSFSANPGARYLATANKNIETATPDSDRAFLKDLSNPDGFSIQASSDIVVYLVRVNGKTRWFFANFKGLKTGDATVPVPVRDVVVTAPRRVGTTLHVLPFLGETAILGGTISGNEVKFVIPDIDRGAIAWTDR
ncbi:MAG: hypothetical protein WA708_11310 [Acidobacteriaceae bacterium]